VRDLDHPEGGDLLPVLRVGEIPREEKPRRWLVEGLWAASAVGWIAGSPKSCKSWLGLDLALSVSTGTPCLGAYPVLEPGGVLVYLAEDALAQVRERLSAIALHRGLSLASLDIHVITEASLRLDLDRDQIRLQNTVRELRPRLLLLDPLVRLHRLDENAVAEVTRLLSYFRDLQRELDLAIALVHHTRKQTSGNQQAGQGLRGTGDLHAWSDSSLYLRRQRAEIQLTLEHRSQPTPPPVTLRLVSPDDGPPHLEVAAAPSPETNADVPARLARPLPERVLDALREGPLSRAALRDRLSVKNERLGCVLDELAEAGRILRGSDGWALASGT
jgi:AAA domain